MALRDWGRFRTSSSILRPQAPLKTVLQRLAECSMSPFLKGPHLQKYMCRKLEDEGGIEQPNFYYVIIDLLYLGVY